MTSQIPCLVGVVLSPLPVQVLKFSITVDTKGAETSHRILVSMLIMRSRVMYGVVLCARDAYGAVCMLLYTIRNQL